MRSGIERALAGDIRYDGTYMARPGVNPTVDRIGDVVVAGLVKLVFHPKLVPPAPGLQLDAESARVYLIQVSSSVSLASHCIARYNCADTYVSTCVSTCVCTFVCPFVSDLLPYSHFMTCRHWVGRCPRELSR